MPRAFELCIKKGGKVITKRINDREYMHICYLNGKAYPGEVKKYKKVLKRKK